MQFLSHTRLCHSFFYPGRPELAREHDESESLRYDLVLYEEPPDYTVGYTLPPFLCHQQR